MDRRGLQGLQTAQDCRDYRARLHGRQGIDGLQGLQTLQDCKGDREYKGCRDCKGYQKFFANTVICAGTANKLASTKIGSCRSKARNLPTSLATDVMASLRMSNGQRSQVACLKFEDQKN